MTRFVELTAIDLNAEHQTDAPTQETELDDLERRVVPMPGVAQPATTTRFFPVMVNPEDVREYYPRKGTRSGTRIVYKNGAARPVKESYDEVKAKFSLN